MVSNVYSYYLNTYGSKKLSRQSSHDRSELKTIYQNMVKVNTAAPFKVLDLSEKSQKTAIDIKEAALSAADTLTDIQNYMQQSGFLRKTAVTDNPALLSVKYTGQGSADEENISISVKQLAEPQTNTGKYLSPNSHSLSSEKYSFDVHFSDTTYELEFTVTPDDNNEAVLNKLARIINRSDIGLHVEILTDSNRQQALSISSLSTGTGKTAPQIFTIEENNSSPLGGSVQTLGLDSISNYPANAVFDLDGKTQLSQNNTFSLDTDYEITLKGTSDQYGTANISLIHDNTAIMEHFSLMVEKVNSLLMLSDKKDNYELYRLHNNLTSIIKKYSTTLKNIGIDINSDGTLNLQEENFKEQSSNPDFTKALTPFTKELSTQMKNIELNPMEYINKKIVSYKNPKRLVYFPYCASIYAGMLFNGYI